MIIRLLRLLLICLCFSAAPLRASEPANRPTPGYVRVLLETTKGKIVVAVDLKRAPRTSRNFLAYVDDGRLDGTEFYRSARRKANPKLGYIQGGIRTNLRRALPPVAHEPTTVTDIKHLDATISMARKDRLGSATGNFFLTVGTTPYMDAHSGYAGYAAFGRVVAGMNVVKRILAVPTSGGTGPMKGQMIDDPVKIVRARRIDGKPQPTKYPRAWLIWER
ncbi:MAG: peptidylprolyl isomerase [Sphingobium sp.]|nr:peptidylprolyl isomerase [Sphingobium sp.]MCP5399561.1 peptidylprolyl isomerase [Sphingomonas sp.]